MESYAEFAPFYDDVMGFRERSARRLIEFIREYHPRTRKVLELACGTGSILKHLESQYEISGLDLSTAMLAVARKKVPKAKLYHQNMVTFRIPEKFDVILCVFDSINHLLRFSDWKKVFANASRHLSRRGLFVFDINTERKLARHVSEPAWVRPFRKNLLIMQVTDQGRGLTNWNVKIFEHKQATRYALHEEDIEEISFPKEKIVSALRKDFRTITVVDDNKHDPVRKGESLYFVCRK
jgi:ubiquinone/menaquinone biosynthesis C-methylase UbiE